jgi:hypothetical protein
MDMNDTTAESRTKRLAKELKELWEKPTTTECLRLSADAEHPQAKNVSKDKGGPPAAHAPLENKMSDVKSVAKKMQPVRHR